MIVTSLPKRRFGVVLLLAAGIGAAGCGGGDDDPAVAADPTETTATTAAPAAAEPTTFEDCADLYIEATSQLDLTGIDIADGLDRDEALLADERLVALEATYPVLADDNACASMLDTATPEQIQAFIARLDPTVLEILRTPAEQFQVISPEIEG